MAGFITPPAPVPFPRTLSGIPTNLCSVPPEGPRMVRAAINWSLDAPASSLCLSFNLQNTAVSVNPISQIASVYIDNSQNTHQLNLYFQDTQYFLEVPAQSQGYYPVQTNGLQCTVWNSGLNLNDACNIYFMNNFVTAFSLGENTLSQVYLLGSNGAQFQEVAGDKVATANFATFGSSSVNHVILNDPHAYTIKAIYIQSFNMFGPNLSYSINLFDGLGFTFVSEVFNTAVGAVNVPGGFVQQLFAADDLQIPSSGPGLTLQWNLLPGSVQWNNTTLPPSISYTIFYTLRS